jgi:hypothetical protein
MKLFDSATGVWVDTDNLPLVYAYNADGTIHTITATHESTSWVKTYTYTGGNVTGESEWVKQ